MDYLIEFDYDADEADELTIHKGDIINSVRPHEDGWMYGILRGKEGVFPSNFGKPVKEDRRKSQEDNLIIPQAEERNNNTKENDVVIEQTPPPKKVTGVGFGNIFSGGEIKLKTTNKDNKPKVISEEVKPEICQEKKPKETTRTKDVVRVIHSYTAENSDELTLEIGDIITVTNKEDEDEGWWRGRKSNGQSGVFPDNFVEPIKEENNKPSRPNNAAIIKAGPPPPVTAAKPKINVGKSIPPRPPQLLEKQASKPANTVKDDGISFDAPVNHKPLVGPNAGRAKRPGKKLPSNINIVTGNTEKPNDDEDSTPVSRSNSHENILIIDTTPAIKLKPKESSISNFDRNVDHVTKLKSKDTILTEKPIESPIGKDKPKDTIIPTSIVAPVEKEPEVSPLKPTQNFKANTLPKNVDVVKVDNANIASLKNENDHKNDIMKLKSKISDLEEKNTDLHKELLELRKYSNEQTNMLKIKINKLTNELDDEKTKRAANEVNFSRLKEKVEDLEMSMQSLLHK